MEVAAVAAAAGVRRAVKRTHRYRQRHPPRSPHLHVHLRLKVQDIRHSLSMRERGHTKNGPTRQRTITAPPGLYRHAPPTRADTSAWVQSPSRRDIKVRRKGSTRRSGIRMPLCARPVRRRPLLLRTRVLILDPTRKRQNRGTEGEMERCCTACRPRPRPIRWQTGRDQLFPHPHRP